MNASMRCAVAVALVAMSGAAGATYKCKDADGKISYSEQPCPGAATQTKLKTDSDAREEFVRRLQTLAKHEGVWDAPTVEKTLGGRLAEVQGMQQHISTYSFATTPLGAPVVGSRVMLSNAQSNYDVGVVELRLDPKRCVSPEMIRQVFGAAPDLHPDQSFFYVVTASGYRTEITGSYGGEATFVQGRGYRQGPRCADFISMRQQAPTQPRSSGSRRR